jgi:hypothetical protein
MIVGGFWRELRSFPSFQAQLQRRNFGVASGIDFAEISAFVKMAATVSVLFYSDLCPALFGL